MRILVLGAGDIGFRLAKRLSREKHDLTIVDDSPPIVKRASEQLDAIVVEGLASSYKTLERSNLGEMDILAAMTSNDEVNLHACRIAKKLGVPAVIARIRNPELTMDDYILTNEELGVDQIIHPEKETANAVVRLIRQSSATDVIFSPRSEIIFSVFSITVSVFKPRKSIFSRPIDSSIPISY